MAKDINDPQGVSNLIGNIDPEFAQMVQYIRKIILDTDPLIGEQVKWNSPSFFYQGEMKPFDPKEYKRDIVVLNLRKNVAMLVFPTGAKINDSSGFLQGKYTDGRKIAVFNTMEEVMNHKTNLQNAIKDWLSKVE
jgi:hypothetical protein